MSTIRIHAHLYQDADGMAAGEFLDTEGVDVPAAEAEARALARATENAREAVEACGRQDELDWSDWRVVVRNQDDVVIADYDLESLLEAEAA